MGFLSRHILTIGRLFVLLFFVANSGFTIALYHCTMGGMSGCVDPDKHVPVNCGAAPDQQPSGASVTSASLPCHVVKVAGGFHTDPSVMDREQGAKHIKVEQVLAPISDCVSISLVDHQSHLLNKCTSIIPQPSVETYVLNSTFLI